MIFNKKKSRWIGQPGSGEGEEVNKFDSRFINRSTVTRSNTRYVLACLEMIFSFVIELLLMKSIGYF